MAQLLGQALVPQAPSQTRVVDVVPADRDDPRGLALSSLLLPLTLASTLTGLMVAVVTRPGLVQVGGPIAAAVLVGAVAGSILQGWLGVVTGAWWANAGVVTLLVLAIASVAAGLTALLGVRGFALAAPLMIFVGNPFSGVSTAPALLPEWASRLGQLLPPGAGGSLLRSSAFFDGNGGAGPWPCCSPESRSALRPSRRERCGRVAPSLFTDTRPRDCSPNLPTSPPRTTRASSTGDRRRDGLGDGAVLRRPAARAREGRARAHAPSARRPRPACREAAVAAVSEERSSEGGSNALDDALGRAPYFGVSS